MILIDFIESETGSDESDSNSDDSDSDNDDDDDDDEDDEDEDDDDSEGVPDSEGKEDALDSEADSRSVPATEDSVSLGDLFSSASKLKEVEISLEAKVNLCCTSHIFKNTFSYVCYTGLFPSFKHVFILCESQNYLSTSCKNFYQISGNSKLFKETHTVSKKIEIRPGTKE